jgi:acyl carrier protein
MNDTEQLINDINVQITETLGVDPPELIRPDAEFDADLGVSEMDIADLLTNIKQDYNFDITPDEIHAIITVQDLYDLALDKTGLMV